MNDKILRKEEMDAFIRYLSEICDVYGPIKRRFDYSFKQLRGEKPRLNRDNRRFIISRGGSLGQC